MENNRELLLELLKTPSPSGFELNMQKKVIELMKEYDDEIITNNNYNVTHVINKDSKVKVLLASHIDEISLYVDKIMENGLIRLNKNGGIRPYCYIGQHVRVIKKNGLEVPGIIGYLPNMGESKIKATDLMLDIGAKNKKEAEDVVSLGDPVIHKMDYQLLQNNRLAARALDDKIACYISLEVLKKVKNSNCKNGVYASLTVGEETTGRGAKVAAQEVKPTCAIVLDVTYVSDVNYLENLTGDTHLGKGPALTVGSLMNDKMGTMFKEIANKLELSVQTSVDASLTHTDTDDIYHYNGGIPTYLINIPLRYMHSSVEVCDLKDVDEIIDLVAAFIMELSENTTFDPFK